MAAEISDSVTAKRDMRSAMMFLQDYGISMALAVKIYNQYGAGVYTILRENPYRLADDISGVGFKIADEIARKAGIHHRGEGTDTSQGGCADVEPAGASCHPQGRV